MQGVDSFLFQFWLYLWRDLTDDHSLLLQASAAILCALMPVSWWLFCRELLPKYWAIAVGVVIAICPSFLTIYGYFISETLLLPLMGLAVFFTARCFFKPSLFWFLAAGIFWTLAALTRYVAMPLGVICIVLLLFRMNRPVLHALILAVPVCGMLYLSAWHGYRSIGFYAPFGVPEMNAILARSQASRLQIIHDHYTKWFRSPSLSEKPMAPFSQWRISDIKRPVYIELEKQEGKDAWERALAKYPVTVEGYLRQIKNNVIFLFFGPSWPDSWPERWNEEKASTAESHVNKWLRFIWAPLGIFVIAGSLCYRRKQDVLHYGFILATMLLMLALSIQFTSVLEGRYRKPLEPMLIVSAALILQSRLQKKKEAS